MYHSMSVKSVCPLLHQKKNKNRNQATKDTNKYNKVLTLLCLELCYLKTKKYRKNLIYFQSTHVMMSWPWHLSCCGLYTQCKRKKYTAE